MKKYLGDGLYADFDGYHIVLTFEDGVDVLNRMCLEPSVYRTLVEYHDRNTMILFTEQLRRLHDAR